MSGFPYQDEIDLYYKNKKIEVRDWLIEFADKQKRISNKQREKLLDYAEQIRFSSIDELTEYVQNLNRIGKKEKQIFLEYIESIEWFPEGIGCGVLDGKIVSRILPNELDLLFQEKENAKKE